MSCGCNKLELYGAKPINVQWTVLKGSTATLDISFLELDEETLFDTDGWDYLVSVYDKYNDSLNELDFVATAGKISITASSDITSTWGPQTGFSTAELRFDVKVTIPQESGDDYVWTPVQGTVCLISDVVSGGSL